MDGIIRAVEGVIERASDRVSRPLFFGLEEDRHDVRAELHDRILQAAQQLGSALGDLVAWHENEEFRDNLLSKRRPRTRRSGRR